jgi:renalase
MTATKSTVAIVGAGIVGLSAARELRDRGWTVTILEKSADVGGRMATRTTDAMAFDHGVPCFDFNTSAFPDGAAIWRPAVAQWGNKIYVGTPNLKAPARTLATGLDIIYGQTVLGMARQTGGWALTLSNGRESGIFRLSCWRSRRRRPLPSWQAVIVPCQTLMWPFTVRAGR